MRIGIDLGGTKTEIAALRDDGAIALRRRVETPAHDYAAIVTTIAQLVREAERDLGAPGSVGVGIPGTIGAGGLVKNANSTVLIGRPLLRDLEAALERPLRIANDANCFALSEARDGAGAGYPTVFGVIAGTGAGGGIAIDGRIVAGVNGIAGEWGHTPLPWPNASESPGPPCYCGRRGCLETWISGTALTRDHRQRTGEALRPTEIAECAAAGDADAAATLDRYIDRFARGLAVVIDVIDPHVVVLGGGVSRVQVLAGELERRLPAYVFSDTVFTAIRRAAHGDSSGVLGAARLWE